MTKVLDVLNFLENYAPYELAESWDNNGLLVGDKNSTIKGVKIALDVTQDVINEAIKTNSNLIIAHHPVIFTSVKSVTSKDYTGNMLISAIKNDISIICMHTNLDSTQNGVNDALAKKLGLINVENLGAGDTKSLGRFGETISPTSFDEFVSFVKKSLGANGLKVVGSNNVKKVAVLGGSGGKLMNFALKNGCDTFVTSDCSYDIFQSAKNLGLNLIDAGHFATENVICDVLLEVLSNNFKDIQISLANHTDIINFR